MLFFSITYYNIYWLVFSLSYTYTFQCLGCESVSLNYHGITSQLKYVDYIFRGILFVNHCDPIIMSFPWSDGSKIGLVIISVAQTWPTRPEDFSRKGPRHGLSWLPNLIHWSKSTRNTASSAIGKLLLPFYLKVSVNDLNTLLFAISLFQINQKMLGTLMY